MEVDFGLAFPALNNAAPLRRPKRAGLEVKKNQAEPVTCRIP
jgi:hypothetical protein